jgi:metallo-beta-lactamase family protein
VTLTLTFHGAAHGVTGSCFLLDTGKVKVLVDCGMFQGSKMERALNAREFPFRPPDLDAVLLTHAHIDHSGLLPKLVRDGFAGPIFATGATVDLCSVMLPDAAYIQEHDAERRNKRERRRHRQPEVPIYTIEDAHECQKQFSTVGYGEWLAVGDGMRARYWNAGHLLGSASIEVEIDDGTRRPTRLLFSGDLGPAGKPFQSGPEAPVDLDFVVCEGTYGAVDRPPNSVATRRSQLGEEVLAARTRGGALLIPSFAVERTQEVLVDLVALINEGRIPGFPIIIDSPLASRATQVFRRHASELGEDGGALERALDSPHVSVTETVEESKALDLQRGFHAVISASGMCDAGRIKHRLKNWLWRADATVLMVGFQAAGTLGRILLDGAQSVRIHGEEIAVAATIRSLDVYSGHADAPELEAWLVGRKPVTGAVFLVHGELPALNALQQRSSSRLSPTQVIIPELDQAFDLENGQARAIARTSGRRLPQEQVGLPDSGNAEADLLLDISDTLSRAPDERSRAVIIRRLKRALTNDG